MLSRHEDRQGPKILPNAEGRRAMRTGDGLRVLDKGEPLCSRVDRPQRSGLQAAAIAPSLVRVSALDPRDRGEVTDISGLRRELPHGSGPGVGDGELVCRLQTLERSFGAVEGLPSSPSALAKPSGSISVHRSFHGRCPIRDVAWWDEEARDAVDDRLWDPSDVARDHGHACCIRLEDGPGLPLVADRRHQERPGPADDGAQLRWVERATEFNRCG